MPTDASRRATRPRAIRGPRLGLPAARRIAIAAQGLADRRPSGPATRRHLRKVFDTIGLIQIDSVNVLARSQELVLFSRIGAHPRTLLADAADDGDLFEYWVHVASIVPAELYLLWRWRMEQYLTEPGQWVLDLQRRKPGFIEQVLERVAEGPLVAGDVSERVGPKGPWWDWDDGKLALEHLFRTGQVTARRRRNDFSRIYELPHLRLPPGALDAPAIPEHEARKELLRRAARHLGVASFADLTDYHRQATAACKPLVDELEEEGELIAVQVEGWDRQGYVARDARQPRRVSARGLLTPFDPIVWRRERAEALFGFNYRIEIYTPPPKRVYGYYVMPFLLGNELVGRVDLKADRATGRLLVQASWVEPGVPPKAIVDELVEELEEMAAWLELDQVVAVDRGDLAPTLAAALAVRG